MLYNADLENAKEQDINLIKKLFRDGVNNRNFDISVLKMQGDFCILPRKNPDGRNVLTLSCKLNGISIGFMTIAINIEEVELWYFSIVENFTNLGYGQKYLDVLFSFIKEKIPNCNNILVRCNDNSKYMINLLNKNNFVIKNQNKQGYKFYYKSV
jgi:RimJ/RimL family protein N-acetyltransferase